MDIHVTIRNISNLKKFRICMLEESTVQVIKKYSSTSWLGMGRFKMAAST